MLGFVVPIYMAFLNWARFKPATEARAQEVYREDKVEGDKVEVRALTSPEIRRTRNGFTEFEMTATVHYALRSADNATLQVSTVLYQSAGCVPGAPSTAYAGPLLPVTRGAGTRLVPVRWRVRPGGFNSR